MPTNAHEQALRGQTWVDSPVIQNDLRRSDRPNREGIFVSEIIRCCATLLRNLYEMKGSNAALVGGSDAQQWLCCSSRVDRLNQVPLSPVLNFRIPRAGGAERSGGAVQHGPGRCPAQRARALPPRGRAEERGEGARGDGGRLRGRPPSARPAAPPARGGVSPVPREAVRSGSRAVREGYRGGSGNRAVPPRRQVVKIGDTWSPVSKSGPSACAKVLLFILWASQTHLRCGSFAGWALVVRHYCRYDQCTSLL